MSFIKENEQETSNDQISQEECQNCQECQEVPEQIIYLSCQHLFCLDCLVNQMSKSCHNDEGDFNKFKCYICGQYTELTQQLQQEILQYIQNNHQEIEEQSIESSGQEQESIINEQDEEQEEDKTHQQKQEQHIYCKVHKKEQITVVDIKQKEFYCSQCLVQNKDIHSLNINRNFYSLKTNQSQIERNIYEEIERISNYKKLIENKNQQESIQIQLVESSFNSQLENLWMEIHNFLNYTNSLGEKLIQQIDNQKQQQIDGLFKHTIERKEIVQNIKELLKENKANSKKDFLVNLSSFIQNAQKFQQIEKQAAESIDLNNKKMLQETVDKFSQEIEATQNEFYQGVFNSLKQKPQPQKIKPIEKNNDKKEEYFKNIEKKLQSYLQQKDENTLQSTKSFFNQIKSQKIPQENNSLYQTKKSNFKTFTNSFANKQESINRVTSSYMSKNPQQSLSLLQKSTKQFFASSILK